MASTSSDAELAGLLGEPPRKRRAAALAAQKNWQMLNKPEDDLLTDEDIIIISQKPAFVKPIEPKLIQNITIVPQNARQSTPLSKRTPQTNSIVIDMLNNRPKRNSHTFDDDTDYEPSEDLAAIRDTRRDAGRAKKMIATPVRQVLMGPASRTGRTQVVVNQTPGPAGRTSRTPVVVNQIQTPRLRGQQLVCIETDRSSRTIVRTNGSQYRKPVVIKLHPNEPLVLPIFEEQVEEIVGTYEVNSEECNEKQSEETVEDLNLDVICESDDKTDDSIEVIEEISDKEVKTNSSVQTVVAPKPHIQVIPSKRGLNKVIETLDMDCENFDDEYTDCLCFDCEDDILNPIQWNQSANEKKEYEEYKKAIVSTKNVKFLPEAEVTEPVGAVTTTVSETTRVVTIPTRTPPVPRTRQQNQLMSQSVRTPIQSIRASLQSIRPPVPSPVNRINILSTQRPQRMAQLATMPTIQIQNPSLNGIPITLVSTSGGIGSPLILAPPTNTIMSGPGLAPGVRVILSAGAPNQTYLMLPRSNANAIPAPNVYLTNQNNVYQQNFQPNANQTIRLQPTQQVRYRAPTPPMNRIRGPTAYRQIPPRQPVVNTYSTAPNTYSTAANRLITVNANVLNQTFTESNQTNANSRADPLFECLTILKGTQTSTKKINMRNVLTIKPLPFSWPSNIDDLINSLIKLDNALMKEKFKESPIAWMVSAQLITPPKCNVCQKGVCNQVNKTLSTKNEYWQCNNQRCNTSYLIDRPRIFAGPLFDIPVSKLLFIIYYWSIQVDVEDLIKTGQIEMGTEKIFNIWQKLQKVCSTALQLKDSKLGTNHRDVEIASIQVGRFHVLGAMEAVTHRTKLSVVPISSIVQNGKQVVVQPFVKWLERGTTIRTCEMKFTTLRDFGFKVLVQSKNEFLATNKNLSLNTIGGYLIHHLQRFFKDFDLATLTSDIVINVLEELLWRERFGTNPFSAFYNIIKHISEQCGIRIVEPMANSILPQTSAQFRTPTPVQAPTRPMNRTPNVVLNDSNSVFVDEYYYSSLKLKTEFTKGSAQEESAKDQIQCHLCQMFFDNILLVKHLLEHLEKERRGRVRKGDNNEFECKHCLRFFSNRTLHMHDELANLKMIPYSCRICAVPFYARQPFIQHMKTSHFSGEMPYYCDICSFRSSFQKNLLDHFEATHLNISQVMCPFCIRIFDSSKFKSLSQFFYRHLATHYAVASVYDCEKCVLTFTTKADLKEHSFKGHNPSTTFDEKFEITPFTVQEEEKTLCVRAREQELFTPNLPTFSANNFPDISAPNDDESTEIEVSCDVSCDVNIEDFLSIEPECQISLTDANTTFENFILPVDCDYTNEQLKQMLTKSFKLNVKNVTKEDQKVDKEEEEEEVEVEVEGVMDKSADDVEEEVEGVEDRTEEKEVEQKTEEKIETEEKVENKTEEKVENKTEEKVENKTEGEIETKSEEKAEKTEENVEKIDERIDERVDEKVEERVDENCIEMSEQTVDGRNDLILSDNKNVVCFECKSFIAVDHFIRKSICFKCNFTTHCKNAFDAHMSGAHTSAPEQYKQSSVLRSFPELISFNVICNECDFSTKDGNQMAIHMINENHFNPLCKALQSLST